MLPGYDLERSTPFCVWAQNVLSTRSLNLCVCVYMHVYTCAYSHGIQKTTLGIAPQELFILFFGQCLSLTWGSPIRLCCLASQLQGCSCLCLPITQVHITIPGFLCEFLGPCAHTASILLTESPLQYGLD